jgi:hypothetical protein
MYHAYCFVRGQIEKVQIWEVNYRPCFTLTLFSVVNAMKTLDIEYFKFVLYKHT